MASNCPDCGVGSGDHCGEQLLVCEHEAPLDARLIWAGCWPGEGDCAEQGWYIRFDRGKGRYVHCDADDPDAQPDLNRLRIEYQWDRQTKRWLRR